MALSKFVLKTLPGIERPAIASLMPTRRSAAVFLDLGANAEVDAANLVQFAVMGEVYARAVLGIAKPTVGLLNIGTERSRATRRSARRRRRCARAICRSSSAASSRAPTSPAARSTWW